MVYFAKWKIALVCAVCLLGLAFASPNIIGKDNLQGLPSWLPGQQINLGLDLQGGSHLLMEVDVQAVLRDRLENLVSGINQALFRDRVNAGLPRIDRSNLRVVGDTVGVTITNPDQVAEARDILADIDEDFVVEEQDGGRFVFSMSEEALVEFTRTLVANSIEVIRRRIDETGTKEPNIQAQGEDRVLLQAPGVDDPEELKRLLGKTAKMTFHLVDDGITQDALQSGRARPGTRILEHAEEGRPPEAIFRKIEVSGDHLVDASQSFDENNQPAVAFRFDTVGAKLFGQVTANNVDRRFAIVLDNQVITAPVIRSPILGGSGIITGSFTVAEAQELSLLLRAGALPAPLTILEERSVGPGLGKDSVDAGSIASMIGLAGVIIFMAISYGRFGLYADIALLFNITLIAAALSVLQATLTLPGIAGIVLTIGMAVDANVLIFERIREEMKGGRGPIQAVDAGYSRAITTIVDANVTTLIAAILLYQFGSGPVRGFAVTLGIGILTSLFTAIMVTRMFVVLWLRRARPAKLPL